ncbi:uncharacterized protein LOC129577686 isoform X2 [Sitodiplosis mosellana]|uniref:uncharacterized protein LOC129577686 isoform X2 n=1 Tax=Sitodiplosis mosellana TaxID=263140 RepID=UPI002444175F|nr:uncharacterized protein LOC129577686 isoform X2 [Sitodiplosis mosellana]
MVKKMDNGDQTKTTENPPAPDQTESNKTTIEETASALVAEVVAEAEAAAATAVANEQHDNQLITSNVKVEIDTDISATSPIATATDTIFVKESTDPVPDSVDLETKVKNSSLPTGSKQVKFLDAATNENSANDGLSDLDAALDNLNDQVTSLLDEASASNVKSNSPDAPLDEALATLNSEVLGLLKESRKIQDELKKVSDAKDPDLKGGSRCGSSQGIDKKGANQYFDYSLYRERSQSPPPHPLITYKWEDIRRDKEKDVDERTKRPICVLNRSDKPIEEEKDEVEKEKEQVVEHLDRAEAASIQIEQQTLEVPTSLFSDPNAPTDVLSFNFDNIDTQRAIDSYSVKSSVKNSSSGILEVLQDLEAEAEREKERKKLNASTTQSHQDLTEFKPKEESKRFALRSLLTRSHSAPKKVQVAKTRADDLDQREKSPPQVKCCHPIVEKLKTMADKQLHKKGSKKSKTTIKTEQLSDEKKIVLAEQTQIIRLKGSPKADRKNVAAYLEKRDSDEVVEILQLDESPSESRKRREEIRKVEEHEKEHEKEEQTQSENDDKGFVVPKNVTEPTDTEPTVEELLEEEFKNDPPKKAPRKTKEHIYEEIEVPGAITHLNAHKLKKPGNLFASAVLHSVLNKEEFKDGLQKQNEIEEAEEAELGRIEEDQRKKVEGIKLEEADESTQKELAISQADSSKNATKPIPEEIIDLKAAEEIQTIETQHLEEVQEQNESDAFPISEIQIKIDESADVEKVAVESGECPSQSKESKKCDGRKDVLVKEEKKVKFSQSTEERYQEKLAAEKGPDKEDVELPEHIKVSNRWSNMSDHEYEPIGEPVATTKPEQSFERPVVKITEPESPITEPPQSDIIVHEERISFDGTESPIRSITPYTDNSRTEDVHTSQIDDSVIEELPLRREDRKKKSFMTNAGETTKNLQSKISSKASNLRTKFKRSLKSSGGSGGGAGSSQKSSGSNLKSSLKSSPKTSQTSPKERKKFKRIDFTNKFKSIHMPKVSRPELPKFKMPDKFKMSRSEAQATDAPVTTTTVTTEASVDEPSALGTADGTPTVVSVVTTEEIIETKVVPKKRFEFGSYPKIFNRFKSQQPTKSDELPHDVTDFVSEDTERDTATQASSSSFSTHFATVPRTASKIKNSLISKWNKTSFSRSADREDSESIPQSGSLPRHHNDVHEDSVERRIRLASKMSMEDEEEPLGILQTKEQIQLASYDEENRAIHEISRAREHEFKARKPLTHQDSDIISDESIRDIDWEECERMRNKIMGAQRTFEYEDDVPKRDSRGRRLRNDSNFSTEETQSSGSSGDRRRTGVIEDIDDDEFFLRQRGVSQDNAEISKYISSAIREGHASYPYDENNADFPDEEYQDFTERPRKPLRRRAGGFNRSYESYDDYHDNVSDHEIPVATQYFPRHDDENILFYDNDFVDDMDHPNILSREEHFDSDIDNEEHPAVKPKVPKRRHKGRAPTKQDSIEANEEVLVYRSEPSFTVPIDEPSDTHFIVKPVRKNRSISSKSDLAPDNQEPLDREPETIEKYSPSNSRYTIDIKETNGYATVKKDPPARPPAPARRHKRSTKSHGGDSLQPDTSRSIFKDSPFPERQKRSFNAPSRPPRRGSSSSLVDQHKPPSIAPSDGTQYEEIDDDLNDDEENEFYPHKMHNRPLPPPPRPPRDKRRRNKSNIDKKFDDNDDDAEQIVAGSFDDSEFSTREFVGAEMATQTSMDIDDLYLNDDVPIEDISTEQCTRTVEEILRSSDEQPTQKTFRTSNDNLAKGIQKFRESNQRSYSERSRASTERQSSRPITPSALVIEQRITRSPVEMDATLIMQPVDDPPKVDYRTDSAESEYVPYADDVDDTHLDTEDERIINAAIRRYQMLGNELDEHSATPRGTTPKATEDENNLDVRTKSTIEAPQPPPRRKSSANATQITDTINVPLAEPETLSVASTQDLNRYTPEPVNDLSSENVEPTHAQVDSLTVVNIQSTESETNEKPETKPIVSNLQITPEVMQVIIERVRETLPVQPPVSAQPALESVESEPKLQEEIMKKVITETETEAKEKASEEPKESEEPPKRPPTPTDYTPTSEIPASFYRLRTGISDDESSLPPSAVPKHRPRKHARRPESSSDEECNRRHHHHPHHSQQSSRSQDLSIADLSGQLIRACGRALSSSLNTAGHSLVDFLRSLTKNQDDQQKDLSLVLVILIIIVASLMMLGISGDRSVHHHHWDYFNPPDNLGRR